ncbi:unnamed protein product [Arabidopsis thaliana]|uniref:Uncharacterized protein n=1 Tax=Arabidopsis thaliana TaxID=3702 RepID=A0A5S9WMF1_ARATH|nr:unnamed protein product [Arabidopsis thaliana]
MILTRIHVLRDEREGLLGNGYNFFVGALDLRLLDSRREESVTVTNRVEVIIYKIFSSDITLNEELGEEDLETKHRFTSM